MKSRTFASGFTLIELTIFIVIIGVVFAALVRVYQSFLASYPSNQYQQQAVQLARSRIELILGQKRQQGYANFTDPCQGSNAPSICNLPSGYSINVSPSLPPSATSSEITLTVTVTEPNSQQIILTSLVGNTDT